MVKPQWQILGKEKPEDARSVLHILLADRGLDHSFLNGTLKDLEAHLRIDGMEEGARIMAGHLCAGSKILLVGDYDCDGITSLAQVSHFLNDIGYRNYEVVVPHRSEGYGIPERAVHEHPDAKVLLAMDCGTLDVRAVTAARELGMECIVIDHHEVPEKGRAPATVLINPKQPACRSTFKSFCSAGLTLLFLACLRRAIRDRFQAPSLGGKYLALAAIGTVADIVPLVDANRILARSGLQSLNQHCFPPVKRIADQAGLSNRILTAGHLGYYIGPRLNAAGRMADARIAFDLLMAAEPESISRLTHELNRLNSRRQQEEDAILNDVRRRLLGSKGRRRTLIIGDHRWNAGVIGIVASRIQQELHYGPVVVFALDREIGVARGSARSVPGFDIHEALKACDDLLLKWGGHKMAAGMTILSDQMDPLADRLEQVADMHPEHVFKPMGKVDLEVDLDVVTAELYESLSQLEPYGMGNPIPTFAARGVKVKLQRVFGREQSHLRLLVNDRVGAVFWRGNQLVNVKRWRDDNPVDLVFQVDWDDFTGKPMLNVKDMGHLFP
ncbi:MAG: single-stranded-DNA-specific exonuclease RecJ [Syntrophobacteraceae bacterium]|nr:single-stranded-DNA-specific exonuclease RecJ [Syntrophobacteraceae bacterium]